MRETRTFSIIFRISSIKCQNSRCILLKFIILYQLMMQTRELCSLWHFQKHIICNILSIYTETTCVSFKKFVQRSSEPPSLLVNTGQYIFTVHNIWPMTAWLGVTWHSTQYSALPPTQAGQTECSTCRPLLVSDQSSPDQYQASRYWNRPTGWQERDTATSNPWVASTQSTYPYTKI